MPSNPTSIITDDPKFLRRVEEAQIEMITMSSQYLQSQGIICRLLAIYFSRSREDSDYSLEPILVMEQADMSLSHCIGHDIFNSLADRVSILRDIANGISAFHDVGIVHGDLKPANCLVFKKPDGRPLAKVADFGCSRFFAEDSLADSYGGTGYWDAPECLEEAPEVFRPYAMRTSRDIFSFGMIVVETIFDEHSLQNIGWRTSADNNGSCNNMGSTNELEVGKMNTLKLNGGIATMAEHLFGERFDLTNMEIRPENNGKDVGTEPGVQMNLFEFDKVISSGKVICIFMRSVFFKSRANMCF